MFENDQSRRVRTAGQLTRAMIDGLLIHCQEKESSLSWRTTSMLFLYEVEAAMRVRRAHSSSQAQTVRFSNEDSKADMHHSMMLTLIRCQARLAERVADLESKLQSLNSSKNE